MAKTYFVPGDELTPEQRESVKKFSSEQDQHTKSSALKEVELQKNSNKATLEQLLKTKISPMEDRVVVYPDPVETMTESGLHKPLEVIERERPCMGTVLAVGEGKKVDEKLTHLILIEILRTTASGDDFANFQSQYEEWNEIPLVPGDRILYGRLAGTPVEDPETKVELLIMRPSDIFAKV